MKSQVLNSIRAGLCNGQKKGANCLQKNRPLFSQENFFEDTPILTQKRGSAIKNT